MQHRFGYISCGHMLFATEKHVTGAGQRRKWPIALAPWLTLPYCLTIKSPQSWMSLNKTREMRFSYSQNRDNNKTQNRLLDIHSQTIVTILNVWYFELMEWIPIPHKRKNKILVLGTVCGSHGMNSVYRKGKVLFCSKQRSFVIWDSLTRLGI